jgi:methionine-rich copper-binding protein CopC
MTAKHLIAACALIVAGAAAQAHAKLESAQPKANSELAGAPAEIRLRFNEPLEAAFSTIALVDASHAAVGLPSIALDKADPTVMFAAVPALKPGTYAVRWSAMSRDGHKVKGQYAFTVK